MVPKDFFIKGLDNKMRQTLQYEMYANELCVLILLEFYYLANVMKIALNLKLRLC